MAQRKLIDADSHVTEPPNLWVERIAKEFRDRAPRVVDNIPGHRPGSYFLVEGMPPSHLGMGLGVGKKPEELPKVFAEAMYADARPGGWDPAERLKDMDLDGVQADVIYTTRGFRIFRMEDAPLQRASFIAYNDWLADYCSYAPNRLAGLGLISLFNIDEAVKDLRHCVKAGLKGAMIWCSPPGDRPYSSPMYDPFWAEAQELNIPLGLHCATGVGPESGWVVKDTTDHYVSITVLYHEVERSLTTLIFSGVLERFPRLKFVSAENEVGWVPFFLQKMDEKQEHYIHVHPTPLKMKFSEYFHRQVYGTFIYDPVGLADRHLIGVDNMLWSTDYPHTPSTWPNSSENVERDMSGIPEEEKEKLTWRNAAGLYGFDVE